MEYDDSDSDGQLACFRQDVLAFKYDDHTHTICNKTLRYGSQD
jgi:hypothetical protein